MDTKKKTLIIMIAGVLIGVALISGCTGYGPSNNTSRSLTGNNVTRNVTRNGTSNATQGGNTSGGGQTATISISAQNIAFNTSSVSVPAGSQVTVKFDNKDNGIPHTFSVYKDSSASQAIFKGQAITGPATTTYTFTAPTTPGTYYFRCDIHPTQMNGQFIVS
jgi:plastocyanin